MSALPESVTHDGSLLAALDLGSNSFHLVVAQSDAMGIRVVDRLRENVRLAAGLDADKRISELAMERALACVARFGQRLRDLPSSAVRAVGTNTLRLARNADEFLARAEEALGHPIDVIPGREEARLIYLGVAHARGGDPRKRLVLDIGGGSTELIVGQGFDARLRESLFMGCVSVSREFFDNGRISKSRMRAAELFARQEIEPVQSMFHRGQWDVAVGCSGTFKSVAAVAQAAGWCDRGLSGDALARLRRALIDAGHVDRLALADLREDRKPVLPGGVAVLRALFASLDIDTVTISQMALREGLLFDLVGRRRTHEDVRDRSIREMCERHAVDVAQADRVEATALHLFSQVANEWGLDDVEDAQLLRWAARVHEVGLTVSHNQQHKHGAYLLMHSDMAGFANLERSQLAALVRGHRRKFPRPDFDALPVRRRRSVRRLCVLLRLAVLLHRARAEPSDGTTTPRASADGDRLTIEFPPGWSGERALTLADLEQEAEYLAPAGFELRFE